VDQFWTARQRKLGRIEFDSLRAYVAGDHADPPGSAGGVGEPS
jgi:hypothetical protein